MIPTSSPSPHGACVSPSGPSGDCCILMSLHLPQWSTHHLFVYPLHTWTFKTPVAEQESTDFLTHLCLQMLREKGPDLDFV